MRLADSNILLYAVSADPAEASKRARAIEVLEVWPETPILPKPSFS